MLCRPILLDVPELYTVHACLYIYLYVYEHLLHFRDFVLVRKLNTESTKRETLKSEK